jgi:hypothetical protein
MLALLLLIVSGCGPRAIPTTFKDPEMDFSALRTVAVMPLENLSNNVKAAERVRDAFANSLLSTGAVYVISSGEVARGIARAGIQDPATPSAEEIAKFAGIIKVDAIFTGVVSEYGTVRSGSASANVISLSLRMIEASTQKTVWTASSTKGGISIWDRLFGSGGEPMNNVTKEAIDDLINKLFT